MPKNEQVLRKKLGIDPTKWPKTCLIKYPKDFDPQIDLVQQALAVATTNSKYARELVQRVDEKAMKRWFIDVALWSGAWRSNYSGVSGVKKRNSNRREPISQKRIEALFVRDKWRCRYCGIRIAGNRKHFKKLATAIGMPELVAGRTDETRHGLYLMLMASYDHVKPRTYGGKDDDDNLVTSCWSCQFGKYKYGLDELQLRDPRIRQPAPCDGWLGLWWD